MLFWVCRLNSYMSGIYKIVNIVNNKLYIGSSKNINDRWIKHKRQLRSNTHHNIHLQRSWNKYGSDNFKFEIVENVDESLLMSREEYWINYTKADYNIGSVGGGDNLTNNPNRLEIIQKITDTLNKNISEMTQEERSKKWGKCGDTNPNWRGGSSDRRCLNCNKSIDFNAKKCSSCAKIGDDNPFHGKTHSNESKHKISIQRTGKYLGSQNKKVVIHGVEYRSYTTASKALGVSMTTISNRIRQMKEGYTLID